MAQAAQKQAKQEPEQTQPQPQQPPAEKTWAPLIVSLGEASQIRPNEYWATVKATCGLKEAPDAAVMAFLMVAKKYTLDPLVRQIYAFEKNGKIVPIVPIDGWMKIINDHPQYDGMEFVDEFDENGKITSITCTLFRKDRSHPTPITEYFAECNVTSSDPWKKWPTRMLRHKATIQAARYAFGISGIFDPDEGDRIKSSMATAEDIAAGVNTHMAEVEPTQAKAQSGLHEQVMDAEFTETTAPQDDMTARDWMAVLDELVPGLQNCKTPVDMKMFLEENKEQIETMGAKAPASIVEKWLSVIAHQEKIFTSKK